MGIIFFIVTFILIFLFFFISYGKKEAVFSNFRLAFIKASLMMSLISVVFTEVLSFSNNISVRGSMLLWLLASLVSLTVFIISNRRIGYSLRDINFVKIRLFFQDKELIYKAIMILTGITILSLFCIACTVNNNWDSFTYHLPKVEHWIQNGNLEFFPTSNTRQLYLAPFEEYVILHLRLLSGNIFFLNFVQFFAYINCLLLTSLIAKFFGLSPRGQIIAIALAATIPMGMMQATSTQTDLVVAFFTMSFVYFAMQIAQEKKFDWENILLLGLSFSLAILAKATSYISLFPFCVVFGLYGIKLFGKKAFLILLSVVMLFLLLNGPFLNRNYQQFGSVLGSQRSAPYYLANLNEEFGFKATLSNIVKNIGSHLALPSDRWNSKVTEGIVWFHDFMSFPLNSFSTSWESMPYSTVFLIQYDFLGNFTHTILFLVMMLFMYIYSEKFSSLSKLYMLLVIICFLLFSFLLKWQPWQNRLNLAIFFLAAPLMAYVMMRAKWKPVAEAICIVLLLVSIKYLFFNENQEKTIFGKKSIFLQDSTRYVYDFDMAKKIADKIKKNNISKVGLVLGDNSWEWQYWQSMPGVEFEHIYFHEDFLTTPNFKKDFDYQAIIVDNNYKKIPKLAQLVANREEDVLELTRIDNRNIVLIILNKPQTIVVTHQ